MQGHIETESGFTTMCALIRLLGFRSLLFDDQLCNTKVCVCVCVCVRMKETSDSKRQRKRVQACAVVCMRQVIRPLAQTALAGGNNGYFLFSFAQRLCLGLVSDR